MPLSCLMWNKHVLKKVDLNISFHNLEKCRILRNVQYSVDLMEMLPQFYAYVVALNQSEDRGKLPVCAMPRGGGSSSNNFRDCKVTLKWKYQQQL